MTIKSNWTNWLAIVVFTPFPSASSAAVVVHRTAVHHVAPSSATNGAVCTSPAADYEDASKKLSLSKAEAEGHHPAAQANDAAVINQATMTMNLMAAHGCKAPTSAPSSDRYGRAAIMCAMAEDVQASKDQADEAYAAYPGNSEQTPPTDISTPTECDMATWTSNGGAQ